MIIFKWQINGREYVRHYTVSGVSSLIRQLTRNEMRKQYRTFKRSITIQSYSITHV